MPTRGNGTLLFALGVALAAALPALETSRAAHRHVIGLALLVALEAAAIRRIAPTSPAAARWTRADSLRSAVIVLLAAVARAAGVRSFPAGLWVDEEIMALTARAATLSALAPWKTLAMRPGWVEIPALYYAWPAALFKVIGVTFVAIKLVSLIPGILAPGVLYCYTRKHWGAPAATAAGLVLALLPWHAGVSRWGWIQVLSTLALLAAYLAIASRRLVPAAILLGLGLYLYESLRIPIAAGVLLALVLARGIRARAAVAALFVAVALPIVSVYVRQPDVVARRAREVSIVRDVAGPEGLRAPLSSAARYLLMLHQTSDPNPHVHPPGRPFLDPFAGSLFVMGLAVVLRQLCDGYPAAIVTVAGYVACLGPGVLTRLADAPHGFRTGAAAPLAAALAGVGAGVLWQDRKLVAALAVAGSMIYNGDLLWRRWPQTIAQEPPLGPEAKLEAALTAHAAFAEGRTVEVSEGLRSETWELLAGEPTAPRKIVGRPAPLWILDPFEAVDRPCAAARTVRDRTGHPLIVLAEGCPPAVPCTAIRVRRGSGPIEAASRIDETPCGGRPCTIDYRARLFVEAAGRYRFQTFSDDGSALSVDGGLVVGNRGESLGRYREGEVSLSAGRHDLSVSYMFRRGIPRLRVAWMPPGGAWEPVPCRLLSTP
ncbi:MAG: hypothetical protein U0166_15865 [Acidobacteriota bacterium]